MKSKSKKPEKTASKAASNKISNKMSTKISAKPAAKAVKPKAKAIEKTAAKKPLQKLAKKEAPIKKLAKAPVAAKPVKKTDLKQEPKAEFKSSSKKLPKLDAKTELKTENLVEKPAKQASAEKAPAKLKAKKVKEVEDAEEVGTSSKEDFPVETKREYVDEEIYLTDADGRRYCRVKECDQVANVDAYCRYHYLLFWKKIQVRKKILTEGKLERYVEELTARYPDKYLEMLRKDLRSEKDFLNAIQELELDENSGENELEDEAQSYIEEVRGMSTEGGASSRDDDEF